MPKRQISSTVVLDGSCQELPDTLSEIQGAQFDRNDLPDTRLVLDPKCPRVTVLYQAGSRIPRAFRVSVPAGNSVVVRARSEFGGVAMGMNGPADPYADYSNVGRMRLDSVRTDKAQDMVIRVTYAPRLRTDPRQSRVLLTVLARP